MKKSSISGNEQINNNTSFTCACYVWISFVNIKNIKGTWYIIKYSLIFGSYKQHLPEQTEFRNYCVSEMVPSKQSTFINFLRKTDREEEKQINTACQHIMTDLLLCLNLAVSSKVSDMLSSFWFNFYDFLRSQECVTIINMISVNLQRRSIITLITFCL